MPIPADHRALLRNKKLGKKMNDTSRFTDTVVEFARKCGVSDQTVRGYIKKGRLSTAVHLSDTNRYSIDPIAGLTQLRVTQTRDSSVIRAVKQQQAAEKYRAEGRVPHRDSALSHSNNMLQGAPTPPPPPPEVPEDDHPLVDGNGMPLVGVLASKAKREHYLAQKAQMEYEQAIGKLIDRELAAEDTLNCYRDFRDSVLTIGPKTAPVLAGMDDVDEIEAYLNSFIRQALIDLADALNRKFKIE